MRFPSPSYDAYTDLTAFSAAPGLVSEGTMSVFVKYEDVPELISCLVAYV